MTNPLGLLARPDGSPLATELTKEITDWFCRGGLKVDRIQALGVPDEWLLTLWNVRSGTRECEGGKG